MSIDNDYRRVMMVLESNYPTRGGGGAEGQLHTIGRYLAANGVEVQVIVPMGPEGPSCEHDTVDGIPVWRVPYPKWKKVGGLVLLFRLALMLFRKRKEYQVIHAHIAHNMAAVSSVVGRLLGKTVVVKITGSRELNKGILDPTQRNLAVQLKRFALRRVSYFQATSRRIANSLVENGFDAEQVRIIPNAIDVAKFDTASETRPSRADARTAVYVGRLEPPKGIDNLVKAWCKEVDPQSSARLLVIGEGSQRQTLEDIIRSEGRDSQIRLLGARDDVGAYLANADFAVLPSRFEGLSNALLEAMAARLPVLGTRVSGTEDFLEDGQCGWLVEADDVSALAEGLRKVFDTDGDQLLRMGEAGYQRVLSRARIDAVAVELAKLYDIDSGKFKSVGQGQCSW